MKKIALTLLLIIFASSAFAIDTGTRFVAKNKKEAQSARYSVKFGDADLRTALRFLAKIADLNVIIPEDIEGNVSVNFDNISIKDAMHSIIKANNLDYAEELGIIRVGKGEKFVGTGEDLKTQTFRLQYASAKELKEEVKPLLSERGSVLADERTNSLIIRDVMTSIGNVRDLVDNVDIRDAQVLIEAKIIEATRDFTRNLGISWFGARGTGKFKFGGVDTVGETTGINNTTYGNFTNLPATSPTSGFGMQIGTLKGIDIGAVLTAAEESGDLTIISEPSIVTSNGKEANIRSGETLLVATSGGISVGSEGSSSSSTSGEVEEIETGVELKVTPLIAANGFIRMDIEAETSQADFSRAVEGLPVIVDNTANTSVMIKDGETTIIGGLFKYNDSRTKRRVPFLSKIPLLGLLFRSKDYTKSNNDLMIFIKPTIVKDISQIPVQARIREIEEFKQRIVLPKMMDEEIDKERQKKYKRSLLRKRESSKPTAPTLKTKSKYVRDRRKRGL
jgi:type IV pilus assembly protein PilQ